MVMILTSNKCLLSHDHLHPFLTFMSGILSTLTLRKTTTPLIFPITVTTQIDGHVAIIMPIIGTFHKTITIEAVPLDTFTDNHITRLLTPPVVMMIPVTAIKTSPTKWLLTLLTPAWHKPFDSTRTVIFNEPTGWASLPFLGPPTSQVVYTVWLLEDTQSFVIPETQKDSATNVHRLRFTRA